MPTVTLVGAERFSIASQSTGRDYDIALARPLPLAATGAMPEDCPIVIVLDSSLTFGTAVERSTMYGAMGVLQSAVIVGVGYPGGIFEVLHRRTPDFTPETPAGKHAEMAPMIGTHFGEADRFLTFLLDELVPAVRTRAPEGAPSRVVLHGFSLAGLFAAYALMTRPDAFETISIMAPSLWWNDFAVPAMVPGLAQKLASGACAPRVVMGVGGQEQDEPQHAPAGLSLDDLRAKVREARMVDAARDLAEELSRLPLAEFQFQIFENEDHAGTLTAGTGRAIAFALRI